MTSRDAMRCHGGRYRTQQDLQVHHIREHDMAPEWGNRFTCVACWLHNIPDLARHRSRDCEDWNALNRINCGFQRQWQEGRAPNDAHGAYPAFAPVLYGEHYRMVKGRYGILPHHIMRWQSENYGPYDPLQTPPGVHTIWAGFTYYALLLETLSSLPPSIAVPPLQCNCTRALQRSLNGTTHSYHHEKHALDELLCQNAVGNFMATNLPLVAQYQHWTGVPWNTTQPHFARSSIAPLNGRGNWVPLSPPGMGIALVGDIGIAESNAQHWVQYQLGLAGGNPAATMNLWQGKTIDDARRGDFTMPGTPRHH